MMNGLDIERERARAQLTALSHAYEVAALMDRSPDNDPYLWGYGGRKIVEMLGQMVQSARAEAERTITP